MKARFSVSSVSITFGAWSLALVSGIVAACSSESSTGGTGGGGDGGPSTTSSTSSGGSSAARTFDCDTLKYACPKEPAPTADEIAECKRVLASKCGDKFRAWGQCSIEQTKCDAEGMFDQTATANACPSTYSPFIICLQETDAAD